MDEHHRPRPVDRVLSGVDPFDENMLAPTDEEPVLEQRGRVPVQ